MSAIRALYALVLIGCTPKPPPQLWTAPVRVPHVEPVEPVAQAEGDIPAPVAVEPGQPGPAGRYVAVPPSTAIKAADWKRRALSLEQALDVAVEDHEEARAWGQHHFGECWVDLEEAGRRESGLRVGAVGIAVLSFIGGAGVAVGVAWAYPR